jgi:hypothetical protein
VELDAHSPFFYFEKGLNKTMPNQKAKDLQPPYQEERESFASEEVAEGLDRPSRSEIKAISEEGSYRDPDGTLRQTLRGDESKGDADGRDIAGSTDFEDTPHGREETKNDKAGAANQNG